MLLLPSIQLPSSIMTDATEEIGRESVLVLSSGICKVTSGGLKLLSFATAKIGGINSFDSRVGALPEEVMEDGLGAFKLKPANLAKAPPRVGGARSSAETPTLTAKEQALQERLKALRSVDDMWGA